MMRKLMNRQKHAVRGRWVGVGVAALVGGLLPPILGADSAAAQPPQRFTFTSPGQVTFTVPGSAPGLLKVLTIRVWAAGAGGGG
ncbi:hypothetical protein, partial [Streptomyces roseochromogenus]|uniref:hypothetical protein n=1 Tax=Streptomyces roseochromogenus TaxID=285450 RepID=UPI001AE0E639